MSGQQHRWTGETIAGRYLLGKYLGGTDHSAVFATEIVHARAQQAAIKLIPATSVDLDRQLSRWKSLAGLSHANLLKILDFGKCELEGAPYLFVVMEYADEDLADILPQRALSADEARGMIEPVLETIRFLHEQKLVHTRLHPGNVLATGDQIKLSSDSIVPVGETIGIAAKAEGFVPPEWESGAADNAGDIWSLGATIVAALTQKAPAFGENGEAILPPEVTEPFASIARGALQQDAKQRISLDGIRTKLHPPAVPAQVATVTEVPKTAVVPPKADKQIDPVAVPLSKVTPPVAPERRMRPGPARPPGSSDRETRSYWMPVAGVIVVAIILFSLPKLFRHDSVRTPVDAATKSNIPEKETPAVVTSSRTTMAMPKKSATEEPALTKTSQPTNPAPAPAVKVTNKPAASDATRGEVLDQVLPDISDKARGTIQGRVRISVRVRVNPAGTVDSAELDTPAPSKYFSEQAIKAAKRWQFSAPELDGHSVASEWVLRFEFTATATNVNSAQVSP